MKIDLDKMKFRHLRKIGHHFFKELIGGRIAIADNSIRNMNDPASTDDGLLWLDTQHSVKVSTKGYSMPLVTAKGERTETPISANEAGYLVKELGLLLHVEGIGFVNWTVNPSGQAGSSQWAVCK